MNEPASTAASPSESTLRKQLLSAAAFPLVCFGLLSVLVIAVGLKELNVALALDRNTAIAQMAAERFRSGDPKSPQARAEAAALFPGRMVYLVDTDGTVTALGDGRSDRGEIRLNRQVLGWMERRQPGSLLATSAALGEEAIISYAGIPGTNLGVVIEEPWSNLQKPAVNYLAILAGLILLGTLFALGMLSTAANRVSRPIQELAEHAARVVPGSTFHPLPEEGPLELRGLTHAFNRMVIRLAEQQASLRQFAQKAILSQEDERHRISRELHDETVQDLVGLVQRIELCGNEMDRNPAAAHQRLDELKRLTENTLNDVRLISNALRPAILEDLGLPAALRGLCDDQIRHMPEAACTCDVRLDEGRLPPEIEAAVYRVAQEALTNVRRHARGASSIRVDLSNGAGVLLLVVENDGPGFIVPNLRTLMRLGHLGLAGMYERAQLLGGRLEIQSSSQGGTRVEMAVPLPEAG